MNKLYSFTVAAILVLLFTTTNAHADVILFANITNSQENPPVTPTTVAGLARPASSGVATFRLIETQPNTFTALTFSATIFNIDFTGTQTLDINDDLRAAHIHAGPLVTPATNGPVVWGFFGTPFNDTNQTSFAVTPFGSGMVGGFVNATWDLPEGNNTTLALQLENILAGRSYINFHTVQFGGGEVRGAIIPQTVSAPIPEPATMLLLGTGLAGVAIKLRRRRQANKTHEA